MQQLPLIQQARIQIPILPHPLTRQESQRANAVVEVDVHNVPPRLLDHLGPVEPVADDGVTTALDENPDGQLRVCRGVGWGKDVGEEAVF